MGRNWTMLLLIFVVLFSGVSSASATPPAKIVSGVVSNVVSALIKWLWSLKTVPKTEISSRSMMKFEGGYTVETVFDGSKLGIDPYSVEVSPFGELLVLDSENSNIYKISTPLSRYGRPKLIAGSPEGYSGHVDGKPREARMNHPKGITLDDRGNIYVADTLNMAIRKISDAGVVTIAGGKWSRGGGHVDGPSEDAKFSDDFDLVYIGSSCSLLVIDRGNQAIREIQLNEDDCNYQYDGNLHLGIAVLVAAGFFGYMLALLQRRVGAMFSSRRDPETSMRKGIPPPPYQLPPKSVRPPLIPTEDEYEKPEEGLFGSMGRLFHNTGSSVVDIFTGLFSGRQKPLHNHIQQQYYQQLNKHSSPWPVQESFVIPDEGGPPPIETRTPAPRRTYPFATKDLEKNHHHHHQQQQQQQQPHQHQHWQYHHQRHYPSGPQTYYEQSCETNEIVFGEVQQEGRRGAVVIKAVDYGDPMYNNHNIRSRYNYMGYS
ncbi:NHL repeat-containing protein [Actinidia chinensis var. chinensis]|uniref:NHL repeat-containing protein n=1 Tax=Actinidia chinensis var. chinensis TaxID=1590841 RepID=A0A2R6RK47_ACTCC|nr:NHL repeat-containing protein [Actinidia chinensis var. chinensis]